MKIKYNFYLNNQKRLKEKPIFLYLRSKKETISISTGIILLEQYWNFKEKKVKQNYSFSFQLNNQLNDFLLRIQKLVFSIIDDNKEITFKELGIELKKRLTAIPEQPKTTINDFWSELDNFINHTKYNASVVTSKGYSRIIKHLKGYELESNIKISFSNINKQFIDNFKTYLLKSELSQNYVKKVVKITKTFLNFCYDNEVLTNDNYKKSKNVESIKITHIALNQYELEKLEKVELPQHLDRARDLFLFGVYSGQRFSDVIKFDIMDVNNGVWELRQKKTDTIVRIPLIEKALNLLYKYNYQIPKLSNQKLNQYLKEIGKTANIIEPVKTTILKGKNRVELIKPKYELLTTHTARRTFVSLSLYNGIPSSVIMTITGHSTATMLNEYFKNDIRETSKLMQSVFN